MVMLRKFLSLNKTFRFTRCPLVGYTLLYESPDELLHQVPGRLLYQAPDYWLHQAVDKSGKIR